MSSAPAPAAVDLPAAERTPVSAWVLAAAWLGYFGMLQWSVVQFRLPIVATLVAVGMPLSRLNSAMVSRPEKPFSAPQGSSQ